jgi:hypothetical protein
MARLKNAINESQKKEGLLCLSVIVVDTMWGGGKQVHTDTSPKVLE